MFETGELPIVRDLRFGFDDRSGGMKHLMELVMKKADIIGLIVLAGIIIIAVIMKSMSGS